LPANERHRLMALRRKHPQHSWAVYHIKNRPAKFVGLVKAPDRRTAITRAINECSAPTTEPRWLMALRRD
jgi:hypothetical protein